MNESIAMLGAGVMGAPMTRNLVKSGFGVLVWNRTAAKAIDLESAGATAAATPAEAAAGATVLITMLYDGGTVESVVPEALAALPDGAIWLQMTTVGPDAAARLEGLARDTGVTLVDAPVLGTRAPAENGALTVLASGPQHARERANPVFDAVAERVLWVEAPQGGQRLKMVANSWVLAATEATAEALRLAEGLGIEPGLFTEAIRGTANDLPYAHIKAKAIREKDFTPSFALDNALKDAGLILAAAAGSGVDMPFTEVVRGKLRRASESGHGDDDVSAIALAAWPS